MGGNAIKSAVRIDKVTFDQYWEELKVLFPEVKMERTRSYRQKEDFGDIDIVVKADDKAEQKAIEALVFERLGKDIENSPNGPFFSFLYKNAQVDFIFHSEKDWVIARNYYSWNDVCNFIGRLARTLDFKFGHDGLFYEKHLDATYKMSVHVSSDIEDILVFLGYDTKKWLQGFDTIEDILEYGVSSKYFNPLYFSLEEQNNIDRVRNKKRKMYQNMLAYIEKNNLQPKPKLTEAEKEFHYKRAILQFGNAFDLEVKVKEAEYAKDCEFKKLFNGDIVKKLTGYEGKCLGEFISQLKAFYPNFKDIVLAGGERVVYALVDNFDEYKYKGLIDD